MCRLPLLEVKEASAPPSGSIAQTVPLDVRTETDGASASAGSTRPLLVATETSSAGTLLMTTLSEDAAHSSVFAETVPRSTGGAAFERRSREPAELDGTGAAAEVDAVGGHRAKAYAAGEDGDQKIVLGKRVRLDERGRCVNGKVDSLWNFEGQTLIR